MEPKELLLVWCKEHGTRTWGSTSKAITNRNKECQGYNNMFKLNISYTHNPVPFWMGLLQLSNLYSYEEGIRSS